MAQFVPAVQSEAGAARIIPGLPPAGSTKTYRLQVGSYKLPRNAVAAFEKLSSVGLEPAYEQYGELYRVVLAGLRGDDIESVAARLGKAGFSEVLIREER
jgi:rare lipoprotein A